MSSKKEQKKELITSPRGMRDILDEDYYKLQGFFEKAQEVATYYGFRPIENPILEHEEVFTSGVGIGTDIVDKEIYSLRTKSGDRLALRPEHTAGLMRAYIEHGMYSLPQPVMFYKYGPVFRHDKPQRGRYRQFWQFDLDILGSDKSIMDALVLRAGMIILSEAGAKNLSLEINSIGDKECRPVYIRELVAYYKKHSSKICADCRERLKTNPLRMLDCKNPDCAPIKEKAPDPVGFLCAPCKHHFKEVLEYLEEMEIPYRMNKNLVRGLSYYTRTVFEIFSAEGAAPAGGQGSASGGDDKNSAPPLQIASGGRYDYLARQLNSKRDVPSVGFSIGMDRVTNAPWFGKLFPRIVKKPKIYFVQLGPEARLKSLGVIEVLRRAHVPVHHSISKDSLSAQLATAEKLQIPHVIILGQKEALENSVIVRNMTTRSQETIKIEKLAYYLKDEIK